VRSVDLDGTLQGVGRLKLRSTWTRCPSDGKSFSSPLLGLLRIFLGEALTLSLLRNSWPAKSLTIAIPRTEINVSTQDKVKINN